MLSNEPDKEKSHEASYLACLLGLENKLFSDSQLRTMKVGPQNVKPDEMGPGMTTVHLIGRVWVQQDFIRLADMSATWMENNVPEEQLSHGLFTGSTQELRKLVGPLPDNEGLEPAWYLCRPGTDCDARVVADELARQPDDHDVLEQAALFFLRTGDYDQAVALQRHCVDVCPPDSDPHAMLAYSLLFKRDFAGARNEISLSHKLHPEEPIEGWLAITYFLEGNYAESAKLLAARPAQPPESPQEIILNYASLARMGRAKQAEALLAERMAKFSGTEEEHLFLLRAAGRIKDFTPKWTDSELDEADAVFYALVRAAKGDTDSARRALEITLQRGNKALPGYLGATVEMERLNAKPTEPKPEPKKKTQP
jgi:tetratricopeptide (TPR) repeat protein